MLDNNQYKIHQASHRDRNGFRNHRPIYTPSEKEAQNKIVERMYGDLIWKGYRHVTNCTPDEALEFHRRGPAIGVKVAVREYALTKRGKIDPHKWAIFMKEV